MKFFRQLAAASLVVAVIVVAAVLWARASGTGADPAMGGGLHRGSGPGLRLSNSKNLVRTCLIEAVLATFVISVSAIRRRGRRLRRVP